MAFRLAVGFVLACLACSPSPATDADRIIVAFEDGTSADAIAALEAKFRLTLVQSLPEANARVYSLSVSNLAETLKQIEGESAVRYAEVDQKVSVPRTP